MAGSHLRWAPDQRLVTADYPEGTVLDGPLAREHVRLLEAWLAEAASLGVVAALDGVREATYEYRRALAGFFRDHREQTAMALVGGSSFVRVLATLFAKVTGVRLAFFDDGEAALAWLRDLGVSA